MSTGSAVGLVIGTHTWTPGDVDKVNTIVELARKHGITTLDTARGYGAGASETVIGTMHLSFKFAIDTKVPTGFVDGAASQILLHAEASMAALQTNRVRTYFLHGPDETIPIAQQMDDVQALYAKGRFDRFGVSNFTQEQFLGLYNYAKSKGYVLPTVYQASYSLAVRRNETTLFPTLRELGVALQAYSPMAAGLLAKSPAYIEQGKGSWDPNTSSGQLYRDMYYKPSYMTMLQELEKISIMSGISRSGLAYRWIRYHSVLQGKLGDEMIIGAANAEQLQDTLIELEKGPLEPSVVERIDDLWQIIKEDAPVDNFEAFRNVFRGF